MKKRIFAMLLAIVMVVNLLPTAVFAEENENTIYICGTDISAGGHWIADEDESGEKTELTACDESDGWNVSYDPDAVKLTLRDAALINTYDDSSWDYKDISVIYLKLNQNLKLVLLDANTGTILLDAERDSRLAIIKGVQGNADNIDISGGGSLSLTFDATDYPDQYFLAEGIYLYSEGITVTGGTSLTVTIPQELPLGAGINAEHLTVDGGSVTINTTGNKREDGSDLRAAIGLVTSIAGAVRVCNDGKLTVTTEDANAILGSTVEVSSGGTIHATAQGENTALLLTGSNDNDRTIDVNGGTMTLIGQPGVTLYNADGLHLACGDDIWVVVNEEPSADGATVWDEETSLYAYKRLDIVSPYRFVQFTDVKPEEPEEPEQPTLPPILPGIIAGGASQMQRFVDVTSMDYYFDAVQWAVEHGITTGTGKVTFSPDAPCTRAQAVTFLWRALGCPAAENAANFTDVKSDAYYADAVAWAVENGVTVGTSATTFSPDAPCTRSQIVTFLYRAIGTQSTVEAGFVDVPANAYYADAVNWAAQYGITGGTGANRFSPDMTCTRAQIVTFLYRAN